MTHDIFVLSGLVDSLQRRVAALEARSGVAVEPATSVPAAPENPAPLPVKRDAVAWLKARAERMRRDAIMPISHFEAAALQVAAIALEQGEEP